MAGALAEQRDCREVLGVAWNGERLRRIRKEAGLTQVELGELAECGQNSVSNWENGERIPGVEELYRLADALEVNCDAFRLPPDADIRFKRKPKKSD